MSNLKKILALVLALVMSMSLVTVAGAAYEDQDQIDARYAEAVQVLSDMGIFKGYNGGTSFGPKALITREEVATMMYRVMSTDLTDTNKGLYVEAAKFEDVPATKWSAGFIGYCYNGGYVKGYDNGTFCPANNVTGYEVLAMILRAVGYDKNNEFSGSDWKKNIGTVAQELGILDNVAPTVVLSQPATRELVAELIFRTMVEAEKVAYTPAFSYQPVLDNINKLPTTIGEDNFGLDCTGRLLLDSWGRPGYKWVWNTGSSVFAETPVAVYKVAAEECELADDIGVADVETSRFVRYFSNGVEEVISVTANHTDYEAVHGGQGTLVEVYPHLTRLSDLEAGDELALNTNNAYTENPAYGDDIIVQIDTYLAEVTDVIEKEVDSRNHIITPAANELEIHFGTKCDNAGGTPATIAGNKYKDGDFILVNVNERTSAIVDLGVAKTVVGAQTINWYFEDMHTIEKKEYDDAAHFSLDKAGYDDEKTFTWFLDQYGNVIGDVEVIDAKTYGIVTSVQWRNPDDENGYARATIMYMDGTTASNKVLATLDGDPFLYSYHEDSAADFENKLISDDKKENDNCSEHLYEIAVDASGKLHLTSVPEVTASATVYAGDPQIDATPNNVYVDNNTKFLIRTVNSAGAFVYTPYDGYDTIKTNFLTGAVIDHVTDPNDDDYAEFVYLIGTPETSTTTGVNYDVFMLTAKTRSVTLSNGDVKLYGVLRADGTTDAVVLTAAAAAAAPGGIEAWVADNVNRLFWEKADKANGKVSDWANIIEITATASSTYITLDGVKNYAQFAGYAYEYEKNGVIRIENETGAVEYYNVNSSTTFINLNGKGTKAEMIQAIKDGAYVYILHNNATISTIFVTTADVAADLGYPVP